MKLRVLVFAIVVLAMGTLVSLNGCGGSGGSTPSPLRFQTIGAPLKAEYFQNDKTPVKDPDDD
jgi:hypothetical protein